MDEEGFFDSMNCVPDPISPNAYPEQVLRISRQGPGQPNFLDGVAKKFFSLKGLALESKDPARMAEDLRA
jgi:hypothetical protein